MSSAMFTAHSIASVTAGAAHKANQAVTYNAKILSKVW
jgi:hypothetical protein